MMSGEDKLDTQSGTIAVDRRDPEFRVMSTAQKIHSYQDLTECVRINKTWMVTYPTLRGSTLMEFWSLLGEGRLGERAWARWAWQSNRNRGLFVAPSS